MPGSFNQRGFGAPVGVQGGMGGLGGGLGGIMNGQMGSLNDVNPNVKTGTMVQDKRPMPGVNSAFMKPKANNPQKGTPSGARSFMNSGAGANGMLNTMRTKLGFGQNK